MKLKHWSAIIWCLGCVWLGIYWTETLPNFDWKTLPVMCTMVTAMVVAFYLGFKDSL